MRQAARATLFLHDRTGRLEIAPDLAVLHLLLSQQPLVERHPDGSRTFVFDLPWPQALLDDRPIPSHAADTFSRLRSALAALVEEAQALGLSRTAALAEAAERVAVTEATSIACPQLDG